MKLWILTTGKLFAEYLTSKNIPTIEYFFSGNSTLCFYALNYNRKNIRHTARLLLLTRVQCYEWDFVLIKSKLILSSYRAFLGFKQAKFPDRWWFSFRFEPTFNTAEAASKNNAQYKSGKNHPKNNHLATSI